jgi:hypothetical protein
MPRHLRLSVVLGAVPLLVGTLIYVTWRFTRRPWLEIAGMLTIPMGFVAVVAGTLALCRHLWPASGIQRPNGGTRRLQAVLVGGLLLANFPAAAYFAESAIDISTRYTVRVHNETDRPIESLVVTGPGVRVELGPIAPGERMHRHMHFSGDGALDFSARQQELQFGGQLEGYVTGGSSGDTIIRITQPGVFEIHPAAP